MTSKFFRMAEDKAAAGRDWQADDKRVGLHALDTIDPVLLVLDPLSVGASPIGSM
jgi:hypothetical protein